MTTVESQRLDQLCINTIRTLSMDAVEQAKSGHPGTPMALVVGAVRDQVRAKTPSGKAA